jgi:hypothetical protein
MRDEDMTNDGAAVENAKGKGTQGEQSKLELR